MTTPLHPAGAVPPRPLSSVLIQAMNALHAFARRIDSSLAARKRVAADRDALGRMSNRELVDIGLDRASVNFVADGGRVRDYPF